MGTKVEFQERESQFKVRYCSCSFLVPRKESGVERQDRENDIGVTTWERKESKNTVTRVSSSPVNLSGIFLLRFLGRISRWVSTLPFCVSLLDPLRYTSKGYERGRVLLLVWEGGRCFELSYTVRRPSCKETISTGNLSRGFQKWPPTSVPRGRRIVYVTSYDWCGRHICRIRSLRWQ